MTLAQDLEEIISFVITGALGEAEKSQRVELKGIDLSATVEVT